MASPAPATTPHPQDTLAQRYQRIRARSLSLIAPLSAEDACVQAMPDTSPATLALLTRHAYSALTDTRVDWQVDPASGAVETRFKASTRALANTSPEPVSNVITSLGEDALFAGGMWTLLHQPLLFLGGLAVFMVLAGLLVIVLWRFVRRLWRKGEPGEPRFG